jgi:hypothetical protein
MKIFMTGISATPYAREYLSKFAATLRQKGHAVFVAHEGEIPPASNPWEENRFDLDATWTHLSDADTMIAVLDGYNVDDAVAAQIGMFNVLARVSDRPRRIIGVLHDTRVAGWSWTAGDRALSPQVRGCIRQFGEVVPNFTKAQELLQAWEG